MHVGERVRRLRGDAKALPRRHGRLALAVAVDVAVEAAVGDVLVDQHGHLDLEAAPEQLHDVPVVDLREDQHLPGELLELLLVHQPGLLDGNRGAVGGDAPVDDAVASSAEDPRLVEVARGLLDLLLGEDLECHAGAGQGIQLMLKEEATVLLEEPLLCSEHPPLLNTQVCREAQQDHQEHANAYT